MGWKTSADHAVAELSRPDREESCRYFPAEHVKVKQRAKERHREQEPHTVVLVVLEVVPRTTTTHSGVEGLSRSWRGRVPKTRQKNVLRVSATRCCKLPDGGVREHPPRTDDHEVAQ